MKQEWQWMNDKKCDICGKTKESMEGDIQWNKAGTQMQCLDCIAKAMEQGRLVV